MNIEQLEAAEQAALMEHYAYILTAAIHQNEEKIDFTVFCAALAELLADALQNIPEQSRSEVARAAWERIRQ